VTFSSLVAQSLWIMLATRLILNTHQHSTTTAEIILSKHLFEDCKDYCDSFGVLIHEYVTDNNPFHGSDWVDDCKNQRQSHKLSGVSMISDLRALYLLCVTRGVVTDVLASAIKL
jgi:hypothetical protein